METDTRQNARTSPWLAALVLAILVAIPLLIGFLGSYATAGNVSGWYADAEKAPWTPPNAVFGPVWSFLYVVMGVAAWLVWLRRGRPGARAALVLYVVQLVLNSVWSPLFFGGYPLLGTAALWIGVVVILALVAVLAVTLVRFWRVNRLAGILLVPYLAWVCYATTLNLYIAAAN